MRGRRRRYMVVAAVVVIAAGLAWAPGSAVAGTAESVVASAFHTCGITTTDTIDCWGQKQYGQATPPPGTFTQVDPA